MSESTSGTTTTGSIVGTFTPYPDQQILLTAEYFLPTGALLQEITATVDNPALASVSVGAPTAASSTQTENDDSLVTIQGLGQVGTTTVRFLVNGVDTQDVVVDFVARPVETIQLNVAGAVVQNTPAKSS